MVWVFLEPIWIVVLFMTDWSVMFCALILWSSAMRAGIFQISPFRWGNGGLPRVPLSWGRKLWVTAKTSHKLMTSECSGGNNENKKIDRWIYCSWIFSDSKCSYCADADGHFIYGTSLWGKLYAVCSATVPISDVLSFAKLVSAEWQDNSGWSVVPRCQNLGACFSRYFLSVLF